MNNEKSLRRRVSWIAFGFSCALSVAAQASEPRLVADLAGPLGSSIGTEFLEALPVGEGVVFALTRSDSGLEIWGTPDAATRAQRLLDVCPSRSGGGNSSPLLLVQGGRVLFSAPCSGTAALWESDGTLAGTRLREPAFEVFSVRAGVGVLPDTGEALIFGSWQGVAGLWAIGAPGQEPRRVAPLSPLSFDFIPRSGPLSAATPHGLVFGARNGLANADVWVSDGTAAGTRRLADLSGPFGENPFDFVQFGARVLFWAGSHAVDLWSTDGTPEGTVKLLSGEASRSEGRPILVGTTRAFVGPPTSLGPEPKCWFTNGTPAGTHATTSCAQVVWKDRAVFPRDDQLWISDGTPGGTASIPGLPDGNWTALRASPHLGLVAARFSSSNPAELWLVSTPGAAPRRLFVGAGDFLAFYGEGGGGLFFADFVAAGGVDEIPRLWRSDGTPPVFLAQGLPLHIEGSSPLGFSVFTEEAWWVTAVDASGARVLRFAENQLEIAALPRLYASSSPNHLQAYGAALYLTTRLGSSSSETLRRITAEGVETVLLPRFGDFSYLALGDRVAYWSESGPYDLWLLDEAGSHSLYRTRAQSYDFLFQPPPFAMSPAGPLFLDSDGLFRIDPAAGRVETVQIFGRGPTDQAPYFAQEGTETFFFHRRGERQNEGDLWRTDGTPAGTERLAEVAGLFLAAGPDRLSWFGDDGRLWSLPRTGGTPLRLEAGPIPRAFGFTVPLANRACLLFSRAGLWASDGSEAGTRSIKPTIPSWKSSNGVASLSAAAFGNRCYFVSDDPDTGHELWSSDGTVAGTRILADLWPGPAGSFPDGLTVVGDRLLFRAADGVHGTELWSTDGTAAGTVRLTDLAPGAASSDPAELTVWGEELVFAASDGTAIGRELWALPLASLAEGEPVSPVAPTGEWLTSPAVPGFRFKVRIAGGTAGRLETACLPETVCVSGALAGRPEVFLRVVGPKPNGFLWPTLVKFSTSGVEVWIEQIGLGTLRYYRLAGARPGFDELPALFDREGFRPSSASSVFADEETRGGEPPAGNQWTTTAAIPGFRFAVTIAGDPARPEAACLAETLCVSGAIAGRSEVFVRVVGPKPNGFLWPTLARFTTSEVDVWIEQLATGALQHYRLESAGPGRDELTGLFDREGFLP